MKAGVRMHLPRPPVNRLREIQLSDHHVAVVSADDYEWLRQFTWRAKFTVPQAMLAADVADHLVYAARTVRLPSGKFRTVYMHREIVKAPKGMPVDHVDGNGLHNWRENLRICTPQENVMNRLVENSLGLRGVRRKGNKYYARIRHMGKEKHLGVYATPEEAAKAYDAAAVELFGAFAVVNFPESLPPERRTWQTDEDESDVPF